MTVAEILKHLGMVPTSVWAILAFLLLELVEISKIKINPLSALSKIFRNIFCKESDRKLDEIRKQIETVCKNQERTQSDLSNHIVQSQRRIILDFADSLRVREKHSKEQFDYVLSVYGEYETYIEQNGIKNGQVNEAICYIREVYQKRLHENDFL